ncbi:hypothetical protein BTS2_3970 [Bacillus sp. TS-2]|nr:hypothetical protein BTS2_3970 [Bacillus sp. TS-2]
MNITECKQVLETKKMDDLLELLEDAESGQLEELELAESVGLCYDKQLNEQLIALLKELGVQIIYLKDE